MDYHRDEVQKLVAEVQGVMCDYWDGNFDIFMEFVEETGKRWMVDYFNGQVTLEQIAREHTTK
jgi:hypothetical protein